MSDDEAGAAISEEIGRIDALLLGRKTYDIFAAYWPHQSDETGGTLKRVPKFVVSNSLVAPITLGQGKRIFDTGIVPASFRLAEPARAPSRRGQCRWSTTERAAWRPRT